MFETDEALFPTGNLARNNLPFHLPSLGQKLPASGYVSPENDPIRREALPVDPRYLVVGLSQSWPPSVSLLLLVFFISLALRLFALRLLLHIGDIIVGIRVSVPVPMKGKLWGRVELPDPSDASSEPYGGVDLVFGMTTDFVNEGRSEGRVLSEAECTAAHRDVMGELTKVK